MGDAAEILGIKQTAPSSSAEVAAKLMADVKPKVANVKKKPKGMSREVFDLIGRGQDALVPSMQSNAIVAPGAFKSKRVSALKGKWIWAPFTSSARPKDEVNKTFHHWVKADVQYNDYPYAKFNVKLDAPLYTDDEYEHLLKSDKWTRAETDHVMYICCKYDLRWPVVTDRYNMVPMRRTEDIQERYYSIVSKIRAHRTSSSEGSVTVKNEASTTFDVASERARRSSQECLFRKSRADEAEEVKLREELKLLDAVLKTKKGGRVSQGGANNAAAGAMNDHTKFQKQQQHGSSYYPPALMTAENKLVAAAAAANAMSYSSSPFTLPLPPDHLPAPGKPCLQSTRLTLGDQNSGLSRIMLKKMQAMLRELGAPEAPVATRAVCDAYDGLKKDTVTLLSIQNTLLAKDKELTTLKALNPSSATTTGGGTQKKLVLPHAPLLQNKMAASDPSRPFAILPSSSTIGLGGMAPGMSGSGTSSSSHMEKEKILIANSTTGTKIIVPSSSSSSSNSSSGSSNAHHGGSTGASEPAKKISAYKRKKDAAAAATAGVDGFHVGGSTAAGTMGDEAALKKTRF